MSDEYKHYLETGEVYWKADDPRYQYDNPYINGYARLVDLWREQFLEDLEKALEKDRQRGGDTE